MSERGTRVIKNVYNVQYGKVRTCLVCSDSSANSVAGRIEGPGYKLERIGDLTFMPLGGQWW